MKDYQKKNKSRYQFSTYEEGFEYLSVVKTHLSKLHVSVYNIYSFYETLTTT